MLLPILQTSNLIIPKMLFVTGFIVILLGMVLIITLIFSRRRQNMLYLQQQDMKARFEAEILQSKIEVQEDTFRHIARELHDNIGQLLSSTKMLVGMTERGLPTVPETLATANETISHAIFEVRNLSRSLDKEWLQQFKLIDNLNTEMRRINAGGGIQAELRAPDNLLMKADEQLILYRMIQEAMQNAIRHAQPNRIRVEIRCEADTLRAHVFNNGKPLPENFQGMGTNNMRNRAKIFGGEVEWLSTEEETEVRISLPLKTIA